MAVVVVVVVYSVCCIVSGLRTITNILQFSLYRLDKVSPVIYGGNIHFALCFTIGSALALHCTAVPV